MSGAASIYESHIAPGARSTRVWSDMEDLSIIQNFDATRWHHATDQLLFNAHQTHGIKSAIVVPTSVYGIGEGIKKLSMGLPMLFEAIKKRGKAFTVNKGEHRMCASHVKDVADVLVTFVEEALSPESKTLTWGKDGYYFIESGGYVFSDITAAAAKLMVEKGLIETEEIDAISPEEVEELVLHPWGSVMWGSNMDVTASRLRALGWEPKQPNVFECISEMLPDLLEREMVIPELLLRLSEPGSTVSRSRS
jgi:nucleoside-diphosphate-sugar epimerase